METNTDPTADEIAAEPLLKLFRHQHLPVQLRAIVQPIAVLARSLTATLPRNPERTTALRKLREAKDCACTALLWDS